MLGKLLKHEFRATGRIMLPVYGAILILALLANLSIRLIDKGVGTLLQIFAFLIIAVFTIAIIAAGILTLVLIIRRFYSNYLRNEGYLMHTLPVNVHGLVWSKVIAACIWFFATFLVIFLVLSLTGLIQSGTNLSDVFAEFPSWKEITASLKDAGIRSGDIILFITEALLGTLLAGLTTCLHFYAAMSLGHMFSKDKILLSIVIFVAISIILSFASTGYGILRLQAFEHPLGTLDEFTEKIRFVHRVIGEGLFIVAIRAALLYLATVFGLKKGLNLA